MPPSSLVDPGPQRSDRSLRRSAGDNLLTLALPVLTGSAGEVVDSSSLRFLTAAALRQRKEEEEKVKREATAQEKVAESEVQQQARLLLERNKRKRKKRRKRRTPRTSSRSLRGRAHRRQRQWLGCNAGSPGLPLRALFPSVSGRLVMLCIMADMDQKGFFMFVDIPFVPQRHILMVQTIQ